MPILGVNRISVELEVFRYQTVGGSLPSLFVLMGENCDESSSLLMRRSTMLPSSVSRKYYFEYVFPCVTRWVQSAPVRRESHDLVVLRENNRIVIFKMIKKIQARIHAKDFESIESLERYIQQPTSFLGKKTLLI